MCISIIIYIYIDIHLYIVMDTYESLKEWDTTKDMDYEQEYHKLNIETTYLSVFFGNNHRK